LLKPSGVREGYQFRPLIRATAGRRPLSGETALRRTPQSRREAQPRRARGACAGEVGTIGTQHKGQ